MLVTVVPSIVDTIWLLSAFFRILMTFLGWLSPAAYATFYFFCRSMLTTFLSDLCVLLMGDLMVEFRSVRQS